MCEEYDVVAEMVGEVSRRLLALCDDARTKPEADTGRRLTMKDATGRSRPAGSEGCRELSSLECLGVDPVVRNLIGDADASKRASGGNGILSASASNVGRDFPPNFRLFLRNQLVLFFSISFSFSLPFGITKAGTGGSGSDGSTLGKGAVDFAAASRLSVPTFSEGTCLSMPLRAGGVGLGVGVGLGDEPRPTVAGFGSTEGGLGFINSEGILRGDLSAGEAGISMGNDGEGSRGAVSALSASAGSVDNPGGNGIGCETDTGESVGSR